MSANNVKTVQHLDDIEIPIIEIEPGWAADSVKTDQDCDNAFAYLVSAVAQIEYQIDFEDSKLLAHQNKEWLARAKCALKYKKAALQIVNLRRGRINQEAKRAWQDSKDRRLLEYIRKIVPDATFLEWVKASNCDGEELEGSANITDHHSAAHIDK
jgi:hypothetical protein